MLEWPGPFFYASFTVWPIAACPHLRMGKKTFTHQKQAQILALREAKMLVKEICQLTRKSGLTTFSLLAKAKNMPQVEVPPHKSVPGHPRKTSAAIYWQTYQKASIDESTNHNKTTKACQPHPPWKCCRKHDLRELRESSEPASVLSNQKTPYWLARHAAHFSFTRKYKDFITEDWRTVL